ncbi:hypothetical protein CI238_08341, partial [Colletotrichum incanum]
LSASSKVPHLASKCTHNQPTWALNKTKQILPPLSRRRTVSGACTEGLRLDRIFYIISCRGNISTLAITRCKMRTSHPAWGRSRQAQSTRFARTFPIRRHLCQLLAMSAITRRTGIKMRPRKLAVRTN